MKYKFTKIHKISEFHPTQPFPEQVLQESAQGDRGGWGQGGILEPRPPVHEAAFPRRSRLPGQGRQPKHWEEEKEGYN